MKKIYLFVALLTASICSVRAELPADLRMPDIDAFIANNPYPDSGSVAWNNDSILYFQYKEPKLIGEDPNPDSIWACKNEQYHFVMYRLTKTINVPYVTSIQNEELVGGWPSNVTYAMSSKTPVNDFPAMTALWSLCEAMKDGNAPSKKRVRQRPFCYFNGWYNNNQYYRTSTKNNDSYPSGHGYFRGLFGKCMELVDPAEDAVIQSMLDEWLHCRLQKGAHWNTDIIAGMQLGEMAFDTAMTCDSFRSMVFAARKELKTYRGELAGHPEVTDSENTIESDLNSLVGSTKNMTINRTMYKDGYFNTLCLPFALTSLSGTPLEGGELFAFEGATKNGDEIQLNIVPVSAIEAGKPYLIRWAGGDIIYTMTFNNVAITAYEGQTIGSEGVHFVGTMGQSELTEGNQNQLFLGANNSLYWPNTNNKLKGFRAYFLVSGDVAPHGAPARIVTKENGATAIGYTDSESAACKRIKDGQVLIIRNDATYNAQGQRVKSGK